MFTTVLPVWGVALLLSISCWSIGSALFPAASRVVAMLAGWCVFLLLCSVPWVAGLSAKAVAPLCWIFFLVGLGCAVRGRRWRELACAAACTAVVAAILGAPFLRFDRLLAYGAHGVDMWGYIITANWLRDHSLRQLPEIGVDPMRFNWTWHVLTTRERPLIYESLACVGTSTGLGAAKAYVAYPVALLASLAMALASEPGLFRLKPRWWLAVPALLMVCHPLVILPWIAGFFGGAITALFVALAFAGAAVPGTRAQRADALGLAALMLVLCAGLYTQKFLYVALALGVVPTAALLVTAALHRERNVIAEIRPGRRLTVVLVAIAAMAFVVLVIGRDQKVDTGESQLPIAAAGHFLGIFGGSSPYVWMGYLTGHEFDRNPLANPLGVAALAAMLALLLLIAWKRWRADRDLGIPILAGLCAGIVWQSAGDELIMAKTLAIFGFALLVVLAAASSDLGYRWLGLAAAVVCCLPALRSAAEMHEIISGPYILCTEDNVAETVDGQDWRLLAYLHFREDRDGFDWQKNPRIYFAVTHFLPESKRQILDQKYHVQRP